MLQGHFTKSELREGLTLYCGYCDIQRVTGYLPEIGYNSGVYGWNCTVYAAGDIAVVTGYRPAGRFRMTDADIDSINAIPARYSGQDRDIIKQALVDEIQNIYWAHVRAKWGQE